MKKMMAVALAALMLLAIGCTGAKENKPANETQPTAAAEQPTAVPTEEPLSDHDRAMQLIESGDYDAAYELLEKIGEAETIAANKYDRAKAMIETGDYETAYTLLDGLDYQDSAELLSDVKFQLQKINLSIAEKGDYVTFGAYEQDNDLSNGKEDIEWLVLAKNEDKLLVISRYVLDYGLYVANEKDVLWKDCALRAWLNGEFFTEAFNARQQEMIAVTYAEDHSKLLNDETVGAIDTDNVFILDRFMLYTYFPASDQRLCHATAFANAQGASEEASENCEWWLKSDSLEYSSIAPNKDISVYGMNYKENADMKKGIRPVILINVEETAASEAVAEEKYNSAVAFIEAGNYMDAYTLLNGLHYKDSKDLFIRVESVLLSQAKAGDFVHFGAYEQDCDLFNGKESIEWLVLDKTEDKILVISRFALDNQPYNDTRADVTWETCSLRTWLNDTFLKNAFNPGEQELIIETTVQPAETNALSDRSEGNATVDRVFLLNYDEANRYFGSSAEMICEATDMCIPAIYTYVFDYSFAEWWLRTPGRNGSEYYISCWIPNYYETNVDNSEGYIRPAMWIKIDPTAIPAETSTGHEAETTETPKEANVPEEFVGTWEGGSNSERIEFHKDGTGNFSMLNNKFALNFTYTIEDGKIHFRYEGCISDVIRSYRIEGNTLKMAANSEGQFFEDYIKISH